MRSLNLLTLVLLVQVYSSLSAIIPQPPKTIVSRQSEDEEVYKFPKANDYYPEGGESLTGFDKFSHSYFSLVDGVELKFTKFDNLFARMVKFYEDFLNFVHDKVHVEGKDYHETAYITGLVVEGQRAADLAERELKNKV